MNPKWDSPSTIQIVTAAHYTSRNRKPKAMYVSITWCKSKTVTTLWNFLWFSWLASKGKTIFWQRDVISFTLLARDRPKWTYLHMERLLLGYANKEASIIKGQNSPVLLHFVLTRDMLKEGFFKWEKNHCSILRSTLEAAEPGGFN